MLVEAAEAIRAPGLPCADRLGGRHRHVGLDGRDPGVTEIQAGSYAVMDNFHAPMAGGFENALTVLATVISRRPDRVIVDAGNKSIGAPALATIGATTWPDAGSTRSTASSPPTPRTRCPVGDVVELMPGYAPATVNWYDAYHVVEDDRVVDIWPVIPRGPGHGGLLR